MQRLVLEAILNVPGCLPACPYVNVCMTWHIFSAMVCFLHAYNDHAFNKSRRMVLDVPHNHCPLSGRQRVFGERWFNRLDAGGIDMAKWGLAF